MQNCTHKNRLNRLSYLFKNIKCATRSEYGGLVNNIFAEFPFISFETSFSSVELPHISLCLPNCQISPNFVIGSASSSTSGASSSTISVSSSSSSMPKSKSKSLKKSSSSNYGKSTSRSKPVSIVVLLWTMVYSFLSLSVKWSKRMQSTSL